MTMTVEELREILDIEEVTLPVRIAGNGENIVSVTMKIEPGAGVSAVTLDTE